MGAPKGNDYWKLVINPGRNRIYTDLNDLVGPVSEWLEFITTDKIEVQQLSSKGVVTAYKQRPMTILGLCNYIGISFETWKQYKKRKAFTEFITRVEAMIFDQKFTYAAIGEFKDNLIARDLGLRDVKETHNFERPILEGGQALPGTGDMPNDELLD